MAATSSTFNSDRPQPREDAAAPPPARCGVPWALLMAIGIVVLAELLLRTLPREKLIAYASDFGQYQAVRDYIDLKGPAEVALVGSSQMREGVYMPTLTADLAERAGRPVSVANYALRAARVDVVDAVVRHLRRQPTPPKMIVVGLSTRDLRAVATPGQASAEPDWPRLSIFWTASDLVREVRATGWRRTEEMPQVIRNYAGRALLTLDCREAIGIEVKQRLFGRFGIRDEREPNPVLGEPSFQHLGSRGERTLSDGKLSARRLMLNAAPSYVLDTPRVPPLIMRKRFTSLTNQLTPADAPESMIVEMPVAEDLRTVLEKRKFLAAFQQEVLRRTEKTRIRYIPATAQPFQPTRDHFSDLQHLNRPGADLFAQWLAQEIAAELK